MDFFEFQIILVVLPFYLTFKFKMQSYIWFAIHGTLLEKSGNFKDNFHEMKVNIKSHFNYRKRNMLK